MRIRQALTLICVVAAVASGCAPKNGTTPPASVSSGSEGTQAPAAPVEEAVTALTGTFWSIVEISGQKVASPAGARELFVQFDEATKGVMGFAGCNTFRGSYDANDSALTFGALASTKMACGGEQDKLEFLLHDALPKVKTYAIKGDTLELATDDNKILVRCQAKKS